MQKSNRLNMKKHLIYIALFFICSFKVSSQSTLPPISFGYYAPYGIQAGINVGTTFKIHNFIKESETENSKVRALYLNPQIAYFENPDIQKNIFLNTELVYARKKSAHSFAPFASVGMGYMLSVQRYDGTVSLSDGKMEFNTKALHQFVPTVNLGFRKDPKGLLGYYFKLFYGHKLFSTGEGSALFGLELGLVFNFKKDKK